MLKLKNARIEKVEDKTRNLYGFKLMGFKFTHELFTSQAFEQEDWVEKLRRVCISFNLCYRYSFEKLLGKGNFAKVCLDKKIQLGSSCNSQKRWKIICNKNNRKS